MIHEQIAREITLIGTRKDKLTSNDKTYNDNLMKWNQRV